MDIQPDLTFLRKLVASRNYQRNPNLEVIEPVLVHNMLVL